SAIVTRPDREATPESPRTSAGRPAKWTGTSARVLPVTAAAAAPGSRFWVERSMSAKTGVAPVCTTVLAVAQNVSGVVITSSPGPSPDARSDKWSAAVQEFTATACVAPVYDATARSNAATGGPVVSQPDSRVATTSAISPGPSSGGANGTGDVATS